MEAAVESAVFGASAGKLTGPIKTDQGWCLIKVEALHPATLNDTTRPKIVSSLFAEWLDEQRRKARVSLPLLETHEESEEIEETEEANEA